MITLASATDHFEARVAELDERVMRVLDVAEFWRWRHLCDGTREAWYILRKPIPGLPAGTALRLADLHERLFCA